MPSRKRGWLWLVGSLLLAAELERAGAPRSDGLIPVDLAQSSGVQEPEPVEPDGEGEAGPPAPSPAASALRGLSAMIVVVVAITGFAHLLEKKIRKDARAERARRDAGRARGELGRIPPPPQRSPAREPPPVTARPAPPRPPV